MNNGHQPASAPRGGEGATPTPAGAGPPATPWWVALRQGLQLASQLVIASPLKLPAKVVATARYVSLALGIWEGVEHRRESPPNSAEAEGSDAP